MTKQHEKHDQLCANCGGQLHDIITSTIEKAETPSGYALFENIPAQECRKCGELWFSIETMRQIEAAVQKAQPPIRKIEVPLYDFAESATV
jgi:YgiT-type zinc finger domain-containing protein